MGHLGRGDGFSVRWICSASHFRGLKTPVKLPEESRKTQETELEPFR